MNIGTINSTAWEKFRADFPSAYQRLQHESLVGEWKLLGQRSRLHGRDNLPPMEQKRLEELNQYFANRTKETK